MQTQKSLSLRPVATTFPRSVLEPYGYAVLAIGGADGDLAKSERDLFIAEGRSRGVPEETLAAWARFDWQGADLPALLNELRPQLTEASARHLLFDAIRVARADGDYSLEERYAVDTAARALAVDPNIVRALTGLAEMEEALVRLRAGLLDVG